MKRILIVEDEFLVAIDLAAQLEVHGYETLGPCTSVKDAMGYFERETFDAAILDVNLVAETSEALAIALKEKGIPFIVASGYSKEQFPSVFSGSPMVSKPVQTDQLMALLSAPK